MDLLHCIFSFKSAANSWSRKCPAFFFDISHYIFWLNTHNRDNTGETGSNTSVENLIKGWSILKRVHMLSYLCNALTSIVDRSVIQLITSDPLTNKAAKRNIAAEAQRSERVKPLLINIGDRFSCIDIFGILRVGRTLHDVI